MSCEEPELRLQLRLLKTHCRSSFLQSGNNWRQYNPSPGLPHDTCKQEGRG